MAGPLRVARPSWPSSCRTWSTSLVFRREFALRSPGAGAARDGGPDDDAARDVAGPIPAWITLVHCLFMAWTVVTAHYPALVIGGFLIFLGFAKATSPFQGRFDLQAPLLVGFFLAGLVIHGGLQGWWIQPFLGSLTEAAAVLRLGAADGVQRQRPDHLPGDAGPEPQRAAEDRRRRGRGRGRRAHRHRQRPEPGRPVAALAVLRRRDLPDRPPARRPAPDRRRHDHVPGDLTRRRGRWRAAGLRCNVKTCRC